MDLLFFFAFCEVGVNLAFGLSGHFSHVVRLGSRWLLGSGVIIDLVSDWGQDGFWGLGELLTMCQIGVNMAFGVWGLYRPCVRLGSRWLLWSGCIIDLVSDLGDCGFLGLGAL